MIPLFLLQTISVPIYDPVSMLSHVPLQICKIIFGNVSPPFLLRSGKSRVSCPTCSIPSFCLTKWGEGMNRSVHNRVSCYIFWNYSTGPPGHHLEWLKFSSTRMNTPFLPPFTHYRENSSSILTLVLCKFHGRICSPQFPCALCPIWIVTVAVVGKHLKTPIMFSQSSTDLWVWYLACWESPHVPLWISPSKDPSP